MFHEKNEDEDKDKDKVLMPISLLDILHFTSVPQISADLQKFPVRSNCSYTLTNAILTWMIV